MNRQTGGLTHTGPKGPMAEPFALSSGRRKEERDGERMRVLFGFPFLPRSPQCGGGLGSSRGSQSVARAAAAAGDQGDPV